MHKVTQCLAFYYRNAYRNYLSTKMLSFLVSKYGMVSISVMNMLYLSSEFFSISEPKYLISKYRYVQYISMEVFSISVPKCSVYDQYRNVSFSVPKCLISQY